MDVMIGVLSILAISFFLFDLAQFTARMRLFFAATWAGFGSGEKDGLK